MRTIWKYLRLRRHSPAYIAARKRLGVIALAVTVALIGLGCSGEGIPATDPTPAPTPATAPVAVPLSTPDPGARPPAVDVAVP